MYVEILNGRYAGQMRDMEPGVAQDLINQGRARAFARPTAATPPLPGGYSGAQVTKAPSAPAVVAGAAEPIIIAGHPVEQVEEVYIDGEPAQIARPAEKKKKNR